MYTTLSLPGIIAITIIFQHNVYVALLENTGESPLLDSRFPGVWVCMGVYLICMCIETHYFYGTLAYKTLSLKPIL
jgi:hypothetical protein